jgi:hypothetical protein
LTRNVQKDLRIGVKIGLECAAGFSFLATLAYLVGGPTAFVARTRMSLPMVLATYAFGGLTGGLLIGLFRPWRTTSFGSFCLGAVSSLPLSTCIMVRIMPRADWYPAGLVIIAVTSLVLGGGFGALFHDETKGWTE